MKEWGNFAQIKFIALYSEKSLDSMQHTGPKIKKFDFFGCKKDEKINKKGI